MGSVNVNRNVADAFYRYKMPRICAKVEGKGNGIKTVIVNMPEVAKALGRPATYPTKYFGCELGAQTQFDFKNERFIVNGSHDSAKLQDLLDGFIRKFVLCPECDNPETELIVSTKRNTISQGCKACGYHGTLDFNHKLNTFILKNPPALDPSMQVYHQGSSLTEGNRGKRSKRSGPGAANGNHDGQDDAKHEGEAPVTPTTPNPKSSKKEKEKAADDDDDDCWTVDVSEAAVRARMQDLTEGAKSMTVSEDSEKNEKQRMDLFYAYLKQRAAAGDVDSPKAVTEILHEAERLEVKSKAPLVMLEVLVRPGALAGDVRRHRALLLRCTRAEPRAQRAVLHALTALCEHHAALRPKVPAILKLLYDEDIVEEKAILEWSAKPSRKYASKEVIADVRRRAAPFLEWLQHAEEDSSGTDSEHDDIEIEYDDRAKATPIKAVSAAPAKPKPQDDDDVDVDIDAI
ncbi:eukaryotic translation initiation factor 5 isoform X1 [Helicoverpa zea]|uniref:eukaryotic translation initiation factor 5 isoform X1 n=1 Tax=Helicoverpa zea TaxID=7113 RepID=UPI001F5995F3|nr:eukaryotic translation initiation factor 5 isoform X1 [Helicoverpa zea]XP_047028132.1 eukaryotic translation initiation factor 5 isoform X1 [Helicoverpa zea]XP_047028134.1 eukaryotic translation initiation factor 5 isoform X1 [Helicoverpa zea]XP_047028135.1 eukaryotic translation initiation factor 5 isoform X1 [Helicoverpa zea]XP_047028136.1 eukaryotic translation initiation factor 5 isoform X1 [Helicoverpa zea]XP_047028137.1 eukaryotic translation initiation factor 5 isoform X1 [Helicoverp